MSSPGKQSLALLPTMAILFDRYQAFLFTSGNAAMHPAKGIGFGERAYIRTRGRTFSRLARKTARRKDFVCPCDCWSISSALRYPSSKLIRYLRARRRAAQRATMLFHKVIRMGPDHGVPIEVVTLERKNEIQFGARMNHSV